MNTAATATATRMVSWSVTLKTSATTWSTIALPAVDHHAAIRAARRLLGNYPVTNVV